MNNEILIHAPAEAVWDLVADVEHWPAWYRACRWVQLDPTAGDWSFRWKAQPVTLRSTVVAADRPYVFAFTADGHGVHADRTFTVRLHATPTPYRYRSIGQGATLGRDKGVANFLGRFNFKGTAGSIVTRWYHVRQVPIFSRRLRILADGTLSFLFGRDMAALGLLERSSAPQPLARPEGEPA